MRHRPGARHLCRSLDRRRDRLAHALHAVGHGPAADRDPEHLPQQLRRAAVAQAEAPQEQRQRGVQPGAKRERGLRGRRGAGGAAAGGAGQGVQPPLGHGCELRGQLDLLVAPGVGVVAGEGRGAVAAAGGAQLVAVIDLLGRQERALVLAVPRLPAARARARRAGARRGRGPVRGGQLGGAGRVGAEPVLERRDAGLELRILGPQLGILPAQRDDLGLERVHQGHQIADRREGVHGARQRRQRGVLVKGVRPVPARRSAGHAVLEKPQAGERLPSAFYRAAIGTRLCTRALMVSCSGTTDPIASIESTAA